MADPQKTAPAPALTPEAAAQVDDFKVLLGKAFKPKTEHAKSEIEIGVEALARVALDKTKLIPGDVLRAIEGMIAEIDKQLSEQLNLVLHHPDFQKLEGTWQGLHHLVFKTEDDEFLKIEVLNVTKDDVLRDFRNHPDAMWDDGALYHKVYTQRYSQYGAFPFGTIIGDFYLDHTPQDVAFLDGMGKIAAGAHSPFIAAASPIVTGMTTWEELPDRYDLAKMFHSNIEYAPWRSLRDSENSRYLGLTMPRFLARLPYGAKTNPVQEFAFEEDTDGAHHDKYCWANSAFAMGANITRSFKYTGWCANIRGVESGGLVELPALHTFKTADGKSDFKCPTEVLIDDKKEKELADLGFMPLLYKKNSTLAAFIGAQSVQRPAAYRKEDSQASANLSARLPYMFAACRFAHYLKIMVRDKIGSYMERANMEFWLNDWIGDYVTRDASASQEQKSRYPLADAKVEVTEIEGNPGFYAAKAYLRPHFQLEGLTAALTLVAKVPSSKGS